MRLAYAVVGQSLDKRVRLVRFDKEKAEETKRLLIECGYEPLIKEFEAVRNSRGELV